MANTPLDLTEWLENVRAAGVDPYSDFATEALDIIAGDRTDDFNSVVEELEWAARREFDEPRRMAEFFTDRHHLLAEIEDRLDLAGLGGDPDDAVGNLIADLASAKAAVRVLAAALERSTVALSETMAFLGGKQADAVKVQLAASAAALHEAEGLVLEDILYAQTQFTNRD